MQVKILEFDWSKKIWERQKLCCHRREISLLWHLTPINPLLLLLLLLLLWLLVLLLLLLFFCWGGKFGATYPHVKMKVVYLLPGSLVDFGHLGQSINSSFSISPYISTCLCLYYVSSAVIGMSSLLDAMAFYSHVHS